MHHVYTIRKISLILCVVLVFLSCNSKAEVGFSVIANGTSDGIRLYFHNIPEDTYSMFVSFLDLSKYDQKEEFATTQIYIFPTVARSHAKPHPHGVRPRWAHPTSPTWNVMRNFG
jgi:hypothetical protein